MSWEKTIIITLVLTIVLNGPMILYMLVEKFKKKED